MRITTVRVISQAFFLVLFVVLIGKCTLTAIDHLPLLRDHLSKFLEVDPLIALSTAVTTHTVYRGLAWSLVVLIATLLIGRAFCGWVCPFGAMHHFTGWLFDTRTTKHRIEANRYRTLYRLKYYILIAMAVGLIGSLQIGLLDPICLVSRSMTVGVLPALNANPPAVRWFGDPRVHDLGWLIGLIFLVLLLMNPRVFRFFCRALCPLGAVLGVLSRFALWRIVRDRDQCVSCGLCRTHCEGACDPDIEVRASECMVCFNCLEDCPHEAVSFRFLPPRPQEVAGPDLTRRGALAAAVTGAGTLAWMRLDSRVSRDFRASVIRPPGAVEEVEFLNRCVKCGQCIRVCPTNVIQPDSMASGLVGLWTPVMNYRVGYCEPNCTACGQVCPTGAIQRMSIDQKRGQGAYADAGPIRLGSAHFDVGRCLPWAKNMPCLVCEENCPVSPKAIYTERRMQVLRDGKKQVVSATATIVKLREWPGVETDPPRSCELEVGSLAPKTDQSFHISLRRPDGTFETHLIKTNTADTVTIDGEFGIKPAPGAMAVLMTELGLPKVDLSKCIGCGICEYKCVVAGNNRAVYVMAVGESRSRESPEETRNRSLRL
jgi:polyferredoxin